MSTTAQALVCCVILAVVMAGAAAVMVWLCRRVAVDALPRQDLAGICTHWAMASDEAWYVAQRAGLPVFRAVAGLLLLALVPVCLRVARRTVEQRPGAMGGPGSSEPGRSPRSSL
ncbi:SdpI family protein [Actinomyces faecalis]|uniref:SdpI family protein n=1 Tax=Actinomyces faecalis TaxID=2722820 RepID=UPI0015546B46|nr:SdpI family protein [Actinomyces faecalis]